MKFLYKISTFLIIALGVLHVSVSPLKYSELTEGALWFVSGGLCIIFLGFLNIALLRGAGSDRVLRIICHVANLMGLGFAAAMFILNGLKAPPSPTSIFVLGLFVFETIAAFWRGRSSTRVQ